VFSRNQFSEKAGTDDSTQEYVVGIKSFGLEEKIGEEDWVTTYRIKDPKLVYPPKNNIKNEKLFKFRDFIHFSYNFLTPSFDN
jgi:hypothetical protein